MDTYCGEFERTQREIDYIYSRNLNFKFILIYFNLFNFI